ncbi:MAG: rRNA maturation RNase YbeY [Ignavibacteriales bacterium]|nr:rRNA maturation RNase YbeY [Ignavibacteriales bacterium]
MIKNLTITNSTKIKINKIKIHNLVQILKSELNFKVESVSINFLTEQQIIPINNEYLGHNFSTDIITFNYSGENYTLDGEIFISLDDALFNAKKYGNDLKNEILRLIIHGFLHLVGYDDKEKNDRTKMKNIENRLVNKYLNHLT